MEGGHAESGTNGDQGEASAQHPVTVSMAKIDLVESR